ncbi:juvenile hormone esterase-like [Epargyreus clarus]|uniref:juvenile hormone esterase-like n=1 Tax=Epargyreus clarus TaxID=520877 RepID=UPI003C2D7669
MTTLGPIRGKLVDDVTTGAFYYSFEGIRYAEAPVKNLRFKPPVPKRPWTTVLNATKPGFVCPQPEILHTKDQMSEDCLFLNIYTPANYYNKLLPVMVFVHTGNFIYSSGNSEPVYGPQILIRQDIIVVTMNYRLGALGFLSLCTEEASGNAGIKDVLLALKLVHSNIERFGGDPNKVTLGGNGAGSAIVQYLMLTNQSKSLFQRVLTHSASVLTEKYIQNRPRDKAISLGKELGLKWTDDDTLLQKLKKVNALDIVIAQEAINKRDPQSGFRISSPFSPTVENEGPTAILTRPPLELMREGLIQNIPIMMGYNNQEGLESFSELAKNPEIITKLNTHFELCIPADIAYPYGSVERRNLALQIKEFYFSCENITFVKVQNFIDLVSDTQYIYGIDKFVRLFKGRKTAPVFYYVFNGDDELNYYKIVHNITYPGACHDDDIGYLFLTSVTKPRHPYISFTTKYILEAFLHNLKQFMLTGNPTPNANINCWPDAGTNGYHLKSDSNNLAVFQRPIPKRLEFWDAVYDEYYSWSKYKGSCFCENNYNNYE